jgi:hypothetical protein
MKNANVPWSVNTIFQLGLLFCLFAGAASMVVVSVYALKAFAHLL